MDPVARAVCRVLRRLAVHPVLVDVGATGGPPPTWRAIARESVYVGFEPNPSPGEQPLSRLFREAKVIGQAVATAVRDDQPFYVTAAPECSSLLRPNDESLANFLFSHFFEVVKTETMRTTTLEAALDSVGLERADWLKIDTQGTDLRVYRGLGPARRARLLAVDVEPGLIDAYAGEDLFVDVHRALVQDGFWLSNLRVRGPVRIRRERLADLLKPHPELGETFLATGVRRTPGWVEARYVRSLESVAASSLDGPAYGLLWAVAMLDDQPGFALDVAAEYGSRFGEDDVAAELRSEAIGYLRRRHDSWRRRGTQALQHAAHFLGGLRRS